MGEQQPLSCAVDYVTQHISVHSTATLPPSVDATRLSTFNVAVMTDEL